MKRIALISTFCDTQVKLDTLKENIIKVKEIGLDVMVISPLHIPKNITDLCDYYFETKDNPLLNWPIRAYTHWYKQPTPAGLVVIHRGMDDYSWAALYQVKKLSQFALSFDYDMFYHMIYDLIIDEVVEKEMNGDKNVLYPRLNTKGHIFDVNLTFMAFTREMMEKVEKEITLDEYLRIDGVAEDEVEKWKNKFNIPVSKHMVSDSIFYWGDYDFFDYQISSEFKIFLNKEESSLLKIIFHGIEVSGGMGEIIIKVNGGEYTKTPNNWEVLEFPIESENVDKIIFEYNGKVIDFTKKYKGISRNLINIE